ncbi:hypothetical protein HK102_006574, partial [Quaeritorhiza haematococci]
IRLARLLCLGDQRLQHPETHRPCLGYDAFHPFLGGFPLPNPRSNNTRLSLSLIFPGSVLVHWGNLWRLLL